MQSKSSPALKFPVWNHFMQAQTKSRLKILWFLAHLPKIWVDFHVHIPSDKYQYTSESQASPAGVELWGHFCRKCSCHWQPIHLQLTWPGNTVLEGSCLKGWWEKETLRGFFQLTHSWAGSCFHNLVNTKKSSRKRKVAVGMLTNLCLIKCVLF